jgi:hypothetical protein
MTPSTTLRMSDRLAAGALPRAILAGTAWGLVVGVALPALNFLECGAICLSDIALTTALSVVAGIAAIGPLAAFRRAA